MIGYVTLGTQNLDRAAAFYDALLGELGATRSLEAENYVAWATATGGPMLSLMLPFDEQPASVGNGTMVALAAESPAQVDALYTKAMELGADDEGAPGERGPGFYAAYFRDPDGNKLAVYRTE
jgi:catechol 2,3-dioxygenase-like lactoylglutathione lyase family enzyme